MAGGDEGQQLVGNVAGVAAWTLAVFASAATAGQFSKDTVNIELSSVTRSFGKSKGVNGVSLDAGLGRDIIRVEGTAEHVPGFPPADQVPQYVVKYAERIGANFGTAARFAALFPEALVITPGRLHA
jgi:hypothetical protein